MAATRITRTRPVQQEAVAEPVKIIEPAPVAELDEPDDVAAPNGGRSARAASGRTDYEAVITRFKEGATNRKGAIRAHCVECMGGAVYEVARCTSTTCSLHPFRMGENPNDARTVAAKAKKEAEAAQQAAAKPARKPAAKPQPAATTSTLVRRTRSK